jgi:hypothetical protein
VQYPGAISTDGLFFLLIVPLSALANYQMSYWCIKKTVSTTPAMHALLVSLTPVKTCFAVVIDTGEVGDIYCPVSMTTVMHDVTGVNDTGDMLRRCH